MKNMWILEITSVVFLLFGSYQDWKHRKISLRFLSLFLGIGCLERILLEGSLNSVIFGWILSGIFLFLSWITKEAFGYGDSLGLLGLSCYLNFWELCQALLWSFGFCFLLGLWKLLVRKEKKKEEIPWYPFLFLGVLGVKCL